MKHDVVPALDASEFRNVVGHFTSGVTIVTAAHDGTHFGATVSAVSSLSADPPMVLVCLNQRLGAHAAIMGAGRFTINILGEGQGGLARTFATRGADKFSGVDLAHTPYGPRLDVALAHLACRVVEHVEGGTHRIFIAEVDHASAIAGAGPLSYFRGRFGRFVPHDEAS
jgi:flavin reductase (DIM6/NTAB) family NADH-FMN oxidoreductase RutF